MKDVKFFSSLPSGWQTIPLKAVCLYTVSNVDKHSRDDELPVRLCNYTDVYKNERVSPELKLMQATATYDEIERFRLEIGDVVITKDSESWDDIGIPAYVEGTADDFVCGYHLAFMRPINNVLEGRFLFRCLQSRPVALQLELEATGVTRYGLPKGAIGNVLIPLPSLETQRLIADYLDRETGRIDALVAEKEKMLALLEEKRQALISRVVTKGLDPNVPMKPSGLDWLGEIPAHWEITHFKYVCELNPRVDIAKINNSDEVTFLPMDRIKNGYYLENIGPFSTYNSSYNIFAEGDILIAKVTPCFENGNIAIAKNLRYGLGFGSSEIFVIRPIEAERFYIFYYLQSDYFKQQGEASMTGAGGLKRVSSEFVRNHLIALPPPKEQAIIADYLGKHTTQMSSISKAIHRTIKLLKERRAALITAAVTGQIPIEEMRK